jgi:4-alpha-glucanotransferase
LRIDHVMCLDRLYWVPHGAAPTDGTYVSYPIDELFAIATLEAHRARALVIGEDLGTVPPAIRHAMARHGLLGTWVAQGALEDVARRGDFARPPRRSVAALNTHDMPTFAGFLAGTDIDDRAALGQIDDAAAKRQHATRAELVHATQRLLDAGDERELLARLVEDLGASDAELVLVNLEDLWLEPRPHNVPGTYRERPNWRRPAAFGVDRLDDVPGVGAVLERLAAARRGTASTAPTI